MERLCRVPECTRILRTMGYCNAHYLRFRKYGDPNIVYHKLIRHGLKAHSLYSTWSSMRDRCNNPNNVCYPYYGGRGIKVCERWSDFRNFVSDMGDKPSKQYSIDRINNNGNYEPSNCRWATQKEQTANQRELRSSNTTGYKGVRLRKDSGRYIAVFKEKHIGSYGTLLEAKAGLDNYKLKVEQGQPQQGPL